MSPLGPNDSIAGGERRDAFGHREILFVDPDAPGLVSDTAAAGILRDAEGREIVAAVGRNWTGTGLHTGSEVQAQPYLNLVPTLYANNTLAIEAAMAATSIYGGTVILPAGIIDCVGELTYPTTKKIKLQGAGRDATYLRWLSDTGAGTWAIAGYNQLYHELCDLTVQGPLAAVLNGTNANMNGVKQLARNEVRNVVVSQFNYGRGIGGDHTISSYVKYRGCRVNTYYLGPALSGTTNQGNHGEEHIEADGPSLASVAIASDCTVFGATWQDIHFGMGPVGILYEVDGSNNAGTIADVVMTGCTFENCGNAFVYSMSATQAGILSATMIGCVGSQGFRAGFVSTALVRNQRAHFDGLASVNLTLQDSPQMVAVGIGPLPSYVQHSGYQALEVNDGGGTALATLIAQNARILTNPLAFSIATTIFRERTYAREAETHYCDGAAVFAGRLVYRSADGGVKSWVTGRAVYGVALQNGAAFEFIPNGRKGIWPAANSTTSAIAVGDPVVPDAATADGKITKAAAGIGASIGVAVEAIAAGATGRVDFTPTGWRF